MSDYERPKQLPGFTITAVQWRDGKVARVTYTPVGKSDPIAPRPKATEPPPARKRGVMAVEQGSLL